MIDAKTLLNPEFQDAELRAYAYLSTQYKRGVKSAVDCLFPFVVHALAAQKDEQLDWQKARTYLRSSYSLSIPFYMLERMQGSLMEAGALRKNELSHALIADDARASLSDKSVDLAVSDIDQVGEALAAFAAGQGRPQPLTATKWGDVIIPFFQSRSPPKDRASAKVDGVIITNPKTFDFTIIADFIMHNYLNRLPIYKVIEQIFYGVLVAEFLTQIETTGNKQSFNGLGVVYDTPVILRLLGCSGKILRDATEELHDTLRDLGCRIYYFKHTYDEVVEALNALLRCYENGDPMFRETQEAIANRELSPQEIYQIRGDLDLRLSARLGLVEHASGYEDRKSDSFQINEAGFKEYLRKNGRWGRQYSLAPERDAMSLALIMRLRNGKSVRDVSKAGYVFITHNTRLAVLAKDFLRDEGQLAEGSVRPIMTVGQISTIAWVVNEVFQDDRRITKELIANCYAARLPDDDFDAKLKEAFVRTNPDQAHELYKNAFLVQSVREVALAATGGHSALLRTLSTAEVLAQAEESKNRALAEARSDERSLSRQIYDQEEFDRRSTKADAIARQVTTLLLIGILIACAYLGARDFGLFGGGERSRPAAIVLTLIFIYSVVDLSKLIPTLSLRVFVQKWIKRAVLKIQSSLA